MPAVARRAATGEPTWSKRAPYPSPAVIIGSEEPSSSRCIWVSLAAAPGAAAKPTLSRYTFCNPAAVALVAAESPEPAASRTISTDLATCQNI